MACLKPCEWWQVAPLAEYHWQRLRLGCQRLAIPCDKAQWDKGLARLLAQQAGQNGVIKLILTAGSGGRGYARPLPSAPVWHWSWHPFVVKPQRWYQQGLSLALASARLADQPLLAGLKHLNRLEQVLSRQQLPVGADDVLLCDGLGRPHSLSCMNLYARFGLQLWTPAVDRCGVSGVARHLLLSQWAGELALTVSHRPVTVSELLRADEVFASNVLTGVVAVKQVGVVACRTGPTAQSLHQRYRQVMGLDVHD